MKGKVQDNLEAACFLKGSYKDGAAEFVVVIVDEVTRGNRHRLQLEKVTVAIKENDPKWEPYCNVELEQSPSLRTQLGIAAVKPM